MAEILAVCRFGDEPCSAAAEQSQSVFERDGKLQIVNPICPERRKERGREAGICSRMKAQMLFADGNVIRNMPTLSARCLPNANDQEIH